MIPAQRFYFLLGLGIPISVFFALITNAETSIIYTLALDGLIIILALIDSWRIKAQRVQVTRQPLARLSIGRANPVTILVQSQNQSAIVRICDYYPIQFTVSSPHLEVKLEPHTKQELIYTISPDKRGEFQWQNIQVRQLGSWGLAWDNWLVPSQESTAVYPDLIALKELTIRLTLENTGTMRQLRRLGNGTEFAELREYRTGDDTRLVDWKATARRARPVVRVLEPEQEQTLIILLDRGRLMTAQVQNLKRFDWGLNATLSLALAGLNRGDRVGVGVFDREIITWIPPERGQHQLGKLIDKLTPIQPVLLEPDYVGAVTKLVNQQTRRALVTIITDIIDLTASAELLAAMVKLTPRYLPFCVTLRDPQIDKLAHPHTPTNPTIESAYIRACALDLLAQRQVAFAQLRKRGVLVLDAPAHQISNQLVERYLQLKARNLL